MRYNIWKVIGYLGFQDYDNSDDYNYNAEVIFDATFKKEDVLKFLFAKYSEKFRNVVLNVEILQTKEDNNDDVQALKKKIEELSTQINNYIEEENERDFQEKLKYLCEEEEVFNDYSFLD